MRRRAHDYLSARGLIKLATLILFAVLLFIDARFSFLSKLSSSEQRLWLPWPKGALVYELNHHAIGIDGSPFTSHLGVMRVTRNREELIQQLEIRVNTTQRSTVLLREVKIVFHKITPQMTSSSHSNPRGYTLTWRELNIEHGFWWTASKAQWSSGGGKVSKQGERWCRTWSKPFSTLQEPSTQIEEKHLEEAHSHCQVIYPLPKGVWLWLVQVLDPSDKHVLFDERSGSDSTSLSFIIPENAEPVQSEMESLSKGLALENTHFHFAEDLGERAEVRHHLIFKNKELTHWLERQGGVKIWSAKRRPWQGKSEEIERGNWHRLQRVIIKGKIPWNDALSVNLDLSAPLRPLDEPWQEVSNNPESSTYLYHILLKRADRPSLSAAQSVTLVRSSSDHRPQSHLLSKVVSELFQRIHRIEANRPSLRIIVQEVLGWIRNHLDYELQSGTPSIEVTLRRRSGDCNELSQIFVALMRSIGIEAEMVFGLIHQDGSRWAYHAWARVSDGKHWYEVDPSRGLAQLNTAYLSFSNGDLKQQVLLQRLMGHTAGKVLSWSK